MTIAAPAHPYLPASFPFAKGKEERFPRARGNLTEGVSRCSDGRVLSSPISHACRFPFGSYRTTG
jgi:hypothetical protein